MPDMELPAFLRRTPPKGNEMTPAPAAEPKTRTKRQLAYVANIKAVIPLTDAASLVEAMKAIEGLKTILPANAAVTISADMGKV